MIYVVASSVNTVTVRKLFNQISLLRGKAKHLLEKQLYLMLVS